MITTAVLAFVAVWIAAVVTVPAARAASGWAVVVGVTTLLLVPAASGIAVVAVLPPLRPLAEVSILGQRLTGLLKVGVAVAAFFGGITMSGLATHDFERAETMERMWAAVGGVAQVFGAVALCAAIAYLWYLPVDLFRARARGRRGAVNWLSRRIERSASPLIATAFRRVALVALSEWWWVVASFYFLPLFLLAAVPAIVAQLPESP